MTEKKVWFITGAGRGLGVDIAKAALSAGHAVVATGRDAAKVAAAVGDHESLLVEPGFFRTELLTNDSTTYAQPTIDDYAERTREIVAAWKSMDGKQGRDPAKLADAIVKLAALKEPPTRFAAGADAVQTFEAKANALLAQAHAHRELSTALAHDNA
jgi:NAD(P)-dependent dehydrogenase (short-subunit alcohol dehydrogenase family)